MRRSLALILAAGGVASCAPTGETAPRPGSASSSALQCFQPSRILNFTRGGTDQIYIRVLGGGVFSLQGGGCIDLGVSPAITIRPAIGISDRLCSGDSAIIEQPGGGFGPRQCRARISAPLTQAEIDALPSAQRP